MIKGWQEGLQLMRVGGKARLTIPSDLGYGALGSRSIPGSSALEFVVELLALPEGKSLLENLPFELPKVDLPKVELPKDFELPNPFGDEK